MVLGRYELIGQLSRSSTGAVWKAHDSQLQREVALKQVSSLAVGLRDQLISEATVLASMDHPHIVAVYDLFETDDALWLVEEWVDGADVSRLLTTAGGLSIVQSLGILRAALQGLAFAHEIGVVHGDVTPSNILVDQQGVSKLVDFGLAGAGSRPGAGSGTPGYASPEAAEGGPLTFASDVWSAAAVLAALLDPSGLTSASPDDRMDRLARSGVPAPVRQVLVRALADDPTARQPNAGVLLAELEEAADQAYGAGWWQSAGVVGVVAAATTATLRTVDDGAAGPAGVGTGVTSTAAVSLLNPAGGRPEVMIRDSAVSSIDRAAAATGAGAVTTKPAMSKNVVTMVAAAAVAVIVLVVFLLTRGDDTPVVAAVLDVPTTSAVVTSAADETPTPDVGTTPASSSTPAPVEPTSAAVEAPSTSPDPSTAAAPGVGIGFNGVYANEAVTTAVEGYLVGGGVGLVQNAQWTVVTTCAPTCVAEVVSSSGRQWTLTENAGAFIIDTRIVSDCFLPSGEKSEGNTTNQVNMTFTPTVVDAGRIRELVGTAVFTQIEACPGQTEPTSVETQAVTLRLADA